MTSKERANVRRAISETYTARIRIKSWGATVRTDSELFHVSARFARILAREFHAWPNPNAGAGVIEFIVSRNFQLINL